MNKLKDWALQALERGPVVPLLPGTKRPRYAKWQQKLLHSAQEVEEHWALNADDNVGTACTQVVVLDIDVKGDARGSRSYDWLVERGYEIPPTYTVRTPTGGLHKYFARPEGEVGTILGFLDGLDRKSVRGSEGQYVVAPGSRIRSDQYVVLQDDTIAPCPPWLLDDELLIRWRREWIRAKRGDQHREGSDYVGDSAILKEEARYLFEVLDRVRRKTLPGNKPDPDRLPRIARHTCHNELKSLFGWLRNERDFGDQWQAVCIEVDELTGADHRTHDPADFIALVRWAEGFEFEERTGEGAPSPSAASLVLEAPEEEWTFRRTDRVLYLGAKEIPIFELPWFRRGTQRDYPPTDWWWNDRLKRPASVMWHGASGVGKTSILWDLLDAVWKGHISFLGEPLEVGSWRPRVLYYEEVGTADALQMLEHYDWRPEDIEVVSCDDLYGLEWETLATSMVDKALNEGFDTIVIDSLSVALQQQDGKHSSLFDMSDALKPFFAASKAHGISWWIVHHDNTAGRAAYGPTLEPAFDLRIHHRIRPDGLDSLEFHKRYAPKPKPAPIIYLYNGQERILQQHLPLPEVELKPDREEKMLRVIKMLHEAGSEGLTWNSVTAELGCSRSLARELLDTAIVRVGGQKTQGHGKGNSSIWRAPGGLDSEPEELDNGEASEWSE